MKKRVGLILLFLSFFIAASLWPFPAQEKIVDWREARNYVGQQVVVEGVIVRTYNSGRACFLNFHPDYRQYLSLVIFASDFQKFPSRPEEYYLNKKVRVKGRVVLYQGRPEIILTSPTQITVVEEKAAPGSAQKEATKNKQSGPGPEKVEEISWEQAASYYGQTVWVRGRVVAANNTGKVCFLNFHRNWRRYFTVVIFASDFHRFPQPPEKLYLNREIRVYGLVREYQGKPEIIVSSPEQIQIID
ncbi:MAG: OB-fold nucleic acid binding domain-containing protein [Candidatus Saccharicenans sp.]